jgi:hypothetical protein
VLHDPPPISGGEAFLDLRLRSAGGDFCRKSAGKSTISTGFRLESAGFQKVAFGNHFGLYLVDLNPLISKCNTAH